MATRRDFDAFNAAHSGQGFLWGLIDMQIKAYCFEIYST
jgi:hypothetical protein